MPASALIFLLELKSREGLRNHLAFQFTPPPSSLQSWSRVPAQQLSQPLWITPSKGDEDETAPVQSAEKTDAKQAARLASLLPKKCQLITPQKEKGTDGLMWLMSLGYLPLGIRNREKTQEYLPICFMKVRAGNILACFLVKEVFSLYHIFFHFFCNLAMNARVKSIKIQLIAVWSCAGNHSYNTFIGDCSLNIKT